MKHLILFIAISVLPFTLLAATGCASTEVLQTTKEVAVNVDNLNRDLSACQKELEKDAKRRVERLAEQRVSLASLEYDLKERLAIRKLTERKLAEKLYVGIQKISEDQIAAERDLADRLARERRALQSSQKKYASQSQALTSLSRQLQELATKRSTKAELAYLAEFGKEVNEQLEALEKAVK